MCINCVFELVRIKVDDENAMRYWQRKQVSCCAATNASRTASNNDVLAFSRRHVVVLDL